MHSYISRGRVIWFQRILSVFSIFTLIAPAAAPVAFVFADLEPQINITLISDEEGNHLPPPAEIFSCEENPLFNPITISGSGSGTKQGNSANNVLIDWGDGTVDKEIGIFNYSSPGPNSDFTFTFSKSHEYTSTGDFIIVAKLYHATDKGQDHFDAESIPVTLCVHVPPPTDGSLTVTKVVEGGDAEVSDFDLFVAIPGALPIPVVSGQVKDLLASPYYTVGETGGPSDYVMSFPDETDDCDENGNVVVAAGNHYTCTIVNTFTGTPPPTECSNDLDDDEDGLIDEEDPGCENPDDDDETDPPPPPPVDPEDDVNECSNEGDDDNDSLVDLFDPSCSAFMPHLTVMKVMKNDNGGNAQASDFTFYVGETEVEAGISTPFMPGLYQVSEDGPLGYDAMYSGDCNDAGGITLNFAENATCTITNDDLPGTLHVKKVVVNDNGGTKHAEDFSFTINDGSIIAFESDGQNDFIVDVGTYSIVEQLALGYVTTYDNCSDLSIPLGGTATCTITNDDEELLPPAESFECSDGIDNDGDEKIDFPDDLGCEDEFDNDESTDGDGGGGGGGGGTPQCADGIDNDGDGKIDHPTDTGCADANDNDESNPLFDCNDGADNDNDGLVDMADPDCSSPTDDSESGSSGSGGGGGGGGGSSEGGSGGGGGGGNGPIFNLPLASLGGLGTSGSGGGGGGGGLLPGLVLGATDDEQVCSTLYLNDYLRIGWNNNVEQVKKLQVFLNEEMGADLPVTGFYGPLTYSWVEKFQLKYWQEILLPWVPHGLPTPQTPTGFVYKTTKRWINMLKCSDLNLPIPQLP